jgi:hypothetical protein
MALTRHFRATLTVDFSVSERFYQEAGARAERLVREEVAHAFRRAAERGSFRVEQVTKEDADGEA